MISFKCGVKNEYSHGEYTVDNIVISAVSPRIENIFCEIKGISVAFYNIDKRISADSLHW